MSRSNNTDTVSVSAAEEDAAMTLLNARNLYVHGEGDAGWTDTRTTKGGERSKRPHKPAKHKNDLAALDTQSVVRRRTPTHANRKGKDLKWMERHLENVIVGKSAVEPPEMDRLLRFEDSCHSMQNQATLRQGYFQVVDMGQLSQGQLLMLAESSQNPVCMPPVLSQRAGVKEEKAASFSGQDEFYKVTVQAPKEPRKQGGARPRVNPTDNSPVALTTDQERAELARRIQQIWKLDNDHVWRLAGRSEPPVINRIQINYLRLYLVVEDFGGYEYALETKKWSNIARKFGMEESNIGKNGHSLRMLYLQYVKPIRQFLHRD